MNRIDIVRAWKDEAYRLSLSEAERAALPENPAGVTELNETSLGETAGAGGLNTSPLVCQVHRTPICPPRSYYVRECPVPLTQRVLCPPKIMRIGCPPLTLSGCPPISLSCPQGDQHLPY